MTFDYTILDCTSQNVKKVVRKVSLENLCKLQTCLILGSYSRSIIEYINTRNSHLFQQHDETVDYWFKSTKPSWTGLTSALIECHENHLAFIVENGDVFQATEPEDIEPFMVDSPEIQEPLLDVQNSPLPVAKAKSREGTIICVDFFSTNSK